MRIAAIDAFPVRLARDLEAATGTAGSPTTLHAGAGLYHWSTAYPCLYATHIETALVRVTLDCGLYGWGEAQAPLAPEVASTIVERLLRPAIGGEEFDGTPGTIERLWWRMYSAMRVRGQTGGFMLDAISGVDIALWDLAGKITQRPVCELAGGAARRIPAYLSGVPRVEDARRHHDQGIGHAKLYFDDTAESLLRVFDEVSVVFGAGHVAVDALWRLSPETAVDFARPLGERGAWFLECPLLPEDAAAHGRLAAAIATPLALGESYRTRFELAPFLAARAMRIVQPDLGRVGLTEGLAIARAAAQHGVDVVPHVSIAMGPQLAAAIHFAAAARCPVLEYNPAIVATANRFLAVPITVRDGHYSVPEGPGLGVELHGLDTVAAP